MVNLGFASLRAEGSMSLEPAGKLLVPPFSPPTMKQRDVPRLPRIERRVEREKVILDHPRHAAAIEMIVENCQVHAGCSCGWNFSR